MKIQNMSITKSNRRGILVRKKAEFLNQNLVEGS